MQETQFYLIFTISAIIRYLDAYSSRQQLRRELKFQLRHLLPLLGFIGCLRCRIADTIHCVILSITTQAYSCAHVVPSNQSQSRSASTTDSRPSVVCNWMRALPNINYRLCNEAIAATQAAMSVTPIAGHNTRIGAEYGFAVTATSMGFGFAFRGRGAHTISYYIVFFAPYFSMTYESQP